jgi:sterol desaturase/sphingolipid hydroxylase (fatty acid hydroxylase superfamily)
MKPAWTWYVGFGAGPLAAAAWTILFPDPLAILGGLLLFTLLEYITHRWILHWIMWSKHHQRHHVYPEEYTMFPWWYIPLVMTGFWLLLPNAMFGGFLWGYALFIWWHHVLHHYDRDKLPGWVQRYAAWHDVHHHKTRYNYGITHPLWDVVFGTYRRPTT